MSFSKWTKYFVNNDDSIPVTFLNKVRHEIARAIDATEGGTYTPLVRLLIAGGGMKLGNVLDSWWGGVFTRSTLFRNAKRVERFAITADDVNAMGTNIVDIISIDGSGMSANRILELKVTADMDTGLVVRVVVDPVSSYIVDLESEGSNLNPRFSLAAGSPAPWVMLWFDKELVDGNALGTWRPFAHGQA